MKNIEPNNKNEKSAFFLKRIKYIENRLKPFMTNTQNYSNQMKLRSYCVWQRLRVMVLCQRISYNCRVDHNYVHPDHNYVHPDHNYVHPDHNYVHPDHNYGHHDHNYVQHLRKSCIGFPHIWVLAGFPRMRKWLIFQWCIMYIPPISAKFINFPSLFLFSFVLGCFPLLYASCLTHTPFWTSHF